MDRLLYAVEAGYKPGAICILEPEAGTICGTLIWSRRSDHAVVRTDARSPVMGKAFWLHCRLLFLRFWSGSPMSEPWSVCPGGLQAETDK